MTTEIEKRVKEEMLKYKPPVPPKKSPKGGKNSKNHSRNASRDSIVIEPFDVTKILSLQSMQAVMDDGDGNYTEEY